VEVELIWLLHGALQMSTCRGGLPHSLLLTLYMCVCSQCETCW